MSSEYLQTLAARAATGDRFAHEALGNALNLNAQAYGVGVDETALQSFAQVEPADGNWNLRPGKVWRTAPDNTHMMMQARAAQHQTAGEAYNNKLQIEQQHYRMAMNDQGVMNITLPLPREATPETPTAAEITGDKLNAWFARLEARVAEIEADDAVMGNREEAKWRSELEAFRADLC